MRLILKTVPKNTSLWKIGFLQCVNFSASCCWQRISQPKLFESLNVRFEWSQTAFDRLPGPGKPRRSRAKRNWPSLTSSNCFPWPAMRTVNVRSSRLRALSCKKRLVDMRTLVRRFFPIWLFLLAGPAVLFLFSQLGVDVAPIRGVQDPFPVFTDVAVDPDANIVAVSDENRFSLRTYDRDLASNAVADPRTVIQGNRTGIDFVCGVAIDPINKQIYAVNNDTAADMMVFNYDANGNVPRTRGLRAAAATTWGVSLDLANDEVAVTVQQINKVSVYRRLAEDDEKPLRVIMGPNTGLSDPHGLFIDSQNNEIFVANHDSYHEPSADQDDPNSATAQAARGLANITVRTDRPDLRSSKGKFVEPSITVYARTADGDALPRRIIKGLGIGLSLPLTVL